MWHCELLAAQWLRQLDRREIGASAHANFADALPPASRTGGKTAGVTGSAWFRSALSAPGSSAARRPLVPALAGDPGGLVDADVSADMTGGFHLSRLRHGCRVDPYSDVRRLPIRTR
jgi:hypothetical protein